MKIFIESYLIYLYIYINIKSFISYYLIYFTIVKITTLFYLYYLQLYYYKNFENIIAIYNYCCVNILKNTLVVLWSCLCPLNQKSSVQILRHCYASKKSSHFSLLPILHQKEIGNKMILYCTFALLISNNKWPTW